MDNRIISYLTLRKVIGILGMSLGFICIIGGLIVTGKVEQSISAYYNTIMRDVMVGILIASGAFLITYKGYDLKDNIITWISGISAMGIALFSLNIYIVHVVFSVIFFMSLAFMSYFQFSKGSNKTKNIIYKTSAMVILGCMILFPISKVLPYSTLVLEIIMLSAFGTSWLTKGIALKENI